MKTALDGNGKKMTANEAVARNETRACCPGCEKPVRLHQGKKIANHFEHLSRTGKCKYEWWRNGY
jgi:competence CoiA-like predicted nuclease